MIVLTGRCIPLCHSVVQMRSFVADTRVECILLGVLLNAVDVNFFFVMLLQLHSRLASHTICAVIE
jgi:hypothetical protein